VQAPTASPLINGQWKLLYTSRPGSSSPIQRTFTAVDAFTVFQEVYLRQSDKARINNCVDFGEQAGLLSPPIRPYSHTVAPCVYSTCQFPPPP
jgi:hypothetical protein